MSVALLMAVAGLAMLAVNAALDHPTFVRAAIGSVLALPWWAWTGFAVVMGALAGGQVR